MIFALIKMYSLPLAFMLLKYCLEREPFKLHTIYVIYACFHFASEVTVPCKAKMNLVWRVVLRSYCAASSQPPPINSKLFVAGLSWSVDEKSLKDAFSSFGQVNEVRILYDKNSGRSRGFGFVNFSTDQEAKAAKYAMDGKAFLGRPLRISYALEKVRGAPIVVPRLSNNGESSN